MQVVKFLGSLKQEGRCLQIDYEGEGVLQIVIPKQQISAALPVITMGGMVIEVTIRPEKDSDDDVDEEIREDRKGKRTRKR